MGEVIGQHSISAEEASALYQSDKTIYQKLVEAGADGRYEPHEIEPVLQMMKPKLVLGKTHCIRTQVIDVGEKGIGQIKKRSILVPWNAPLQREINQLRDMVTNHRGEVANDIVERISRSVIVRQDRNER
jgi:hypothetical protein